MAETTRQRELDPTLFNLASPQPALLASQCRHCNEMAFPVNKSCIACGSLDVEVRELPRRGKLWTWTIQSFMPKEPYHSDETPATFKPYGMGYVELDGAIRVETRLTENDPARLKIGADCELVFYTHRTDADGTEVINYAFKPV